MKKITILSVFLPLILFFCLSLGVGLWIEHGRALPNGPALAFISNGKYNQTPQAIAALEAQGYLYGGNYLQVINLLQGRVLPDSDLVMLIRAELAQHQDTQVLSLLRQFYQLPDAGGLWGLYFADQGNLTGAEKILQQTSSKASDLELYFQLGLAEVQIKQGKLPAADTLLATIRKTNPDSAYLAVVEGDEALARGNAQQAWSNYQRAKNMGHLIDDPWFLTQYGLSGLGAGQNVQPVVQELAQVAPLSGMDNYLEAQVFLRQGDWTNAQAKLRAALAQPQFPAKLRGPVGNLAAEVEARLRADATLKAIVARNGQ